MKANRWIRLIVWATAAGCGIACSANHARQATSQQPERINAPVIKLVEASANTSKEDLPISTPRVRSVRLIDFRNFDYCTYPVRNGNYGDWHDGLTLKRVSFSDLNGDGREEAIVVFSIDTEGSMGADRVYILTLEKRTPKVMWSWDSGDRAEGGLHRIGAEKGRLWVETYGVGTNLDNDASSEFTGLCCPKHFTRTFYEWHKEDFRAIGRAKVLPVPVKR